MMRILRPSFKRSRGFTLIEVLIAMAMLAVLSLLVYQATVRSFDINQKLSVEAVNFSSLSVTLQALQQDVSQLYSIALSKDLLEKGQKSLSVDGSGRTSQVAGTFWSAPIRSDGLRRTRFIGSRDKITFVTNSNRHVQAGQKESDILKITWEIVKNKRGEYSLSRSSDANAFNYEDSKINDQIEPEKYELLETIKSASFSFYQAENQKWDDGWDSENQYSKEESRYPTLISLKVELPDPTNPSNTMQWESIFKPNVDFNLQKPKETSNLGLPSAPRDNTEGPQE